MTVQYLYLFVLIVRLLPTLVDPSENLKNKEHALARGPISHGHAADARRVHDRSHGARRR